MRSVAVLALFAWGAGAQTFTFGVLGGVRSTVRLPGT